MATHSVRAVQCKRGEYAAHTGPGVYLANNRGNTSGNISARAARNLAARLIRAADVAERKAAKPPRPKRERNPRPEIGPGESLYRVFVSRHYIAVQSVEVVASSPARAKLRAESIAQRIRPDARAAATDNGWIADDEPVTLDRVGQCAKGSHSVREVAPRAYVFRED